MDYHAPFNQGLSVFILSTSGNTDIDLMHDDVTRPKGSMVVVVTLKSKMAAGSASSGGNSKSTGSMIYLKAQTNRSSCYSTAQPHQNTCQHYCHLNFPLFGEIRSHVEFVLDYNYHMYNARLSRKSIVLRHYA